MLLAKLPQPLCFGQGLYLSESNVSGTLADSLFANWTNLEELVLFSNSLEGPLPTQWGLAPSLSSVLISGNFLNGTIDNLVSAASVSSWLFGK